MLCPQAPTKDLGCREHTLIWEDDLIDHNIVCVDLRERTALAPVSPSRPARGTRGCTRTQTWSDSAARASAARHEEEASATQPTPSLGT